MVRRTFVLAAALLLASAPGMASAQTYGGGTVAVSDSTVVPGQTITVTACCFSGVVEFAIAGRSLGSGVAALDGNVSAQVTIPTDLAPGTYPLTATGFSLADFPDELTVTTNITVVGADDVDDDDDDGVGVGPGRTGVVRGGTGTLPRTGAESTFPLVQTGAVLVLVGAGVLFSIRNRRTGSARNAAVIDES